MPMVALEKALSGLACTQVMFQSYVTVAASQTQRLTSKRLAALKRLENDKLAMEK